MKIVRLLKKIKNVEIFFDDSSSVKIRYDVVLRNGLRRGDEINRTELQRLLKENQEYLIKESAFRLLGNRSHSSFELSKKLEKKFPNSKGTIRKAIKELQRLNLIDDKKFAEEFAESRFRSKGFGVVRLRAELLKRGVERSTVEEVLEKFSQEKDFTEAAMNLANKKLRSIRNRKLNDEKIKGRLFNFLKSRGFTNDVIYGVFQELGI